MKILARYLRVESCLHQLELRSAAWHLDQLRRTLGLPRRPRGVTPEGETPLELVCEAIQAVRRRDVQHARVCVDRSLIQASRHHVARVHVLSEST